MGSKGLTPVVGLASGQTIELSDVDFGQFESAEPGAWIDAVDDSGRAVRINPMRIEYIRSKERLTDQGGDKITHGQLWPRG